MSALAWLVPAALGLGALALAAFLWALHSGQFDDLDGAAWRAIADQDLDQSRRPNDDRAAASGEAENMRGTDGP